MGNPLTNTFTSRMDDMFMDYCQCVGGLTYGDVMKLANVWPRLDTKVRRSISWRLTNVMNWDEAYELEYGAGKETPMLKTVKDKLDLKVKAFDALVKSVIKKGAK